MKNIAIVFLSLCCLASFGQKKKSVKVIEKEPKIIEIKSSNNVDVMIDTPQITPEQVSDENTIYQVSTVETPPDFPGGITKFQVFVEKNITISDEMKSEKIFRKVFASFVVEKDGYITNIKVLRDFGFDSGKEALRVLKSMPNWIPAKKNGKKVRCIYTVPITFDATK